MSGLMLLCSDSHGVYIPETFAMKFQSSTWGFNESDWAWDTISSGPDTEGYWDAWDEILNKASYKDNNGNVWSLHQDGDLWAVCVELMTDEEYEGYFGEKRN